MRETIDQEAYQLTDAARTAAEPDNDRQDGLAARPSQGYPSIARETVRMAISSLRPADSPRTTGENAEHTRLLAESRARLPPIIVQRSTLRVIDGMHRLRAAALRGEAEIEVQFFDGTEWDSFLLAVESNIAHGLPLSLADRTAAAKRILQTHPQWSDGAIGEVTGLDAKTIGGLRQSSSDIPKLSTRIGRDGRIRPLDGSEGRRLAGALLTEQPDAPLRQIARAAGVSLGTVSDVRRRIRSGQDPVPSRKRMTASQAGMQCAVPEAQRGGMTDPKASERNRRITLQKLRRDPSLRFTEAGRALLRRLEVQAVETEEWEWLLDSVPKHCIAAIVELAWGCSGIWKDFAVRLEQRERSNADASYANARTDHEM
ncbi:ParB/RepB/Spo0J family partition protein [Streptomyces antimycoticus]|uniref:ParB/RepB/Spo0J family partition protein n=1 Tax=Streptomyces antimycoticus TaxID=68175 RepID=UPI001F29A741|nr:ParB/RepB/Spo0J family partition protein [Streptomyces antimycoticus]